MSGPRKRKLKIPENSDSEKSEGRMEGGWNMWEDKVRNEIPEGGWKGRKGRRKGGWKGMG